MVCHGPHTTDCIQCGVKGALFDCARLLPHQAIPEFSLHSQLFTTRFNNLSLIVFDLRYVLPYTHTNRKCSQRNKRPKGASRQSLRWKKLGTHPDEADRGSDHDDDDPRGNCPTLTSTLVGGARARWRGEVFVGDLAGGEGEAVLVAQDVSLPDRARDTSERDRDRGRAATVAGYGAGQSDARRTILGNGQLAVEATTRLVIAPRHDIVLAYPGIRCHTKKYV